MYDKWFFLFEEKMKSSPHDVYIFVLLMNRINFEVKDVIINIAGYDY